MQLDSRIKMKQESCTKDIQPRDTMGDPHIKQQEKIPSVAKITKFKLSSFLAMTQTQLFQT